MQYVRDRAPRADIQRSPGTSLPGGTDERPLRPTIARWQLDVGERFEFGRSGDPWEALVRESIADYCGGRADLAGRGWSRDVVWRVTGHGPMSGEHRGPERIFAYHRTLDRLTGGTFRQRLVALQSGGGPIVEAHVRTTARRGARRLDIPSLIVFELASGRIHTITELPGDQAAWDGFWTD